jgi:hypothetical protein
MTVSVRGPFVVETAGAACEVPWRGRTAVLRRSEVSERSTLHTSDSPRGKGSPGRTFFADGGAGAGFLLPTSRRSVLAL